MAFPPYEPVRGLLESVSSDMTSNIPEKNKQIVFLYFLATLFRPFEASIPHVIVECVQVSFH